MNTFKKLDRLNKQAQQAHLIAHAQRGAIWISTQFLLGKITEKEYEAAMKAARKYAKETTKNA